MTIELKITGNHGTDLAAQIQELAEIFGVGTETPKKAGGMSGPVESTISVSSQPEALTEVQTPTGKTDDKKSMPRKEQDVAVQEMIAAGAKDARFDLLTKGRQNEVEEALAKPAQPVATEKSVQADLDDMFGDEPKKVTREDVSALMGKVGKDSDGNPIQERLLKIREILIDHIPEGQETKVKNLPEDQLSAVFALIEKLGG